MKPSFLLVSLALLSAICDAQQAPAPTRLATIQNPQITELSGLAASRRYPGLFYVHNDSGDTARVFLINLKGQTVATINLTGATATDCEDIALSGTTVYLGDIGDNKSRREGIQIYRFAEPALDVKKLGQTLDVEPQTAQLRYSDGPHNAETLLAAPGGRILILTKSEAGSLLYGTVFNAATPQLLKPIGKPLHFGGDFSFTKLATGGDFSPDGRKLVVLTYAQLLEWRLPTPFDTSKLAQLKPTARSLPELRQWESAGYSADGKRILVSSEGESAPLYAFKSAFKGNF